MQTRTRVSKHFRFFFKYYLSITDYFFHIKVNLVLFLKLFLESYSDTNQMKSVHARPRYISASTEKMLSLCLLYEQINKSTFRQVKNKLMMPLLVLKLKDMPVVFTFEATLHDLVVVGGSSGLRNLMHSHFVVL